MNKQQLASLIWDYCNDLRGSISTVEYKDIILGFIFYRYLSECETQDLMSIHWTEEDLATDLNTDEDAINHCKSRWGFFIKYEHLFSTWHKKTIDDTFNISMVTDALSEFTRSIAQNYQNVYADIFKSLRDKLSKLGTIAEQTKHVKSIIDMVNYIPMDNRQGYDVLGFIYEYLLANFASNAGKKDGEFYTPHEISVLMSEIVADHLKDREEINIFDPTSGSGSLLINIGQSLQKYLKNKDKIIYYAQDKIEDTYNLTRMNLVMRGIKPANIFVRCANTLETDWPYIDNKDQYTYIPVDCVVSNPPYSQKWDPENHTSDKRYRNYGLAPASKADYAFLLHDLYHLKDDGIMCIVLPHGVLFRGGDEKDIRTKLVEENNIETIIGLPANIFYGTGIPTIIMVLKKHRSESDILFVDASLQFTKEGSKNKLSGHHIKRITDAVLERKDIPHFAKLVKKEELIRNDYNLNIPRYISANMSETPYDINATILGNIPNYEIALFDKYWKAFPTLREQLFTKINDHLSVFSCEHIRQAIEDNADVKAFDERFKENFAELKSTLCNELIEKPVFNPYALKKDLTQRLFALTEGFDLVDKYQVFKAFDDEWDTIQNDLLTIIKDGFKATRQVADVKSYDKKTHTINNGTNEDGKIIPFAMIAKVLFADDFRQLEEHRTAHDNAVAEFDAYWGELDNELKDTLKKVGQDDDDESEINSKLLAAKKKEVYAALENDRIRCYKTYLSLPKKEQLKYEKANPKLRWPDESKRNGNGSFNKTYIDEIINDIKDTMEIDEDDDDFKIRKLYLLNAQVSATNKALNSHKKSISARSIEKLPTLSDDEVKVLLRTKWIAPIMDSIFAIPSEIVKSLTSELDILAAKYAAPITTLTTQIAETERQLKSLLGDLVGDEYDMQGIDSLASLLGDDDGLFEKMFPQNDENVPRIRFKGFTDKWKTYRLGDIGYSYTGLSGKSKADFGHGKAKFVKYTNIFQNPIADLNGTDSVEIDAAQNPVEYGDAFFTTSSETPEEVGMSSVWMGDEKNVYLNSFCFGYRLNKTIKIDEKFFAYLLRSPEVRQKFQFLAQGISRYNIQKTKAMDISIRVPSDHEEQIKLGNLFYTLEKQIKLLETQCLKLKNIKSALLEKMFI